jgi:hypothetical protein
MATKVIEKSKSQQIREYLKSAKTEEQKLPMAVVTAFKEKGITISAGLVSQIKNKMLNGKKKTNRKMRRKEQAQRRVPRKQDVSLEHLVCAKNLLAVFNGNIQSARAALETVKKLMS